MIVYYLIKGKNKVFNNIINFNKYNNIIIIKNIILFILTLFKEIIN